MNRVIGFAAKLWLGAWIAVSISGSVFAADSVADFYRGKQISLVVGSGTGGGYDAAARVAARHLGKYIPGNPTFIVQNMPGAGGVN